MLKMLVISDMHRSLKEEEIIIIKSTDNDVIISLGDNPGNTLGLIDYGVLGNHDSFGILKEKDLHSKLVNINNLSITGFQGSHRYKSGNFPMYTQFESEQLVIPKADILISHEVSQWVEPDINDTHCGLKGISNYLDKHIPFLHIHGHHHKDSRVIDKNGITYVIGVYGCSLITITDKNEIVVDKLF